MRLSLLRRSLIASEVLWTVSLCAAALAAHHAAQHALVRGFVLAEYAVGSLICHQKPERSFHLWGAQLPVCARCTGIYLGAALCALLPRLPRAAPVQLLSVASCPTVLTLMYEWGTGTTPSNWTRAAAGVVLGAAVMIVLRAELQSD